jgi:uncharacterized protein YbaP (TraB family)
MKALFKQGPAALCAALLLSGCGAFSGDDQQARPALWLASDEDSQIYLLGSMHALPRAMDWESEAVAKAMASSEKLVLELAPEESKKAGTIFAELSPRETPIPIQQRLTGEAYQAYWALPKREQALFADSLDDWAIMVLLGQKAARDANLKTAFGVETGLTEYFSDKNRPIIGLETAHSQLMMFETLDPATQRQLLSNTLTQSKEAAAKVTSLLNAWAQGDVKQLEIRINEDVESVPAAHKALIIDRNLRWADWTAQQMQGSGTMLIAVGAGHMVGKDGLPALLEQRGFKVQRLQ